MTLILKRSLLAHMKIGHAKLTSRPAGGFPEDATGCSRPLGRGYAYLATVHVMEADH